MGGDNHHHFPIGSSVEVRTNEKGFKKVFFSATVIQHKTKKSRVSVEVEYDHLLVSEGKQDRLREAVDIQFVRPTPPPEVILKGFEPNDVVDALYNDGWWNGVVSRVEEAGNKFVVIFDDPPDELAFPFDQLRNRWDWVDGMWVRSQNKAELVFEVGREVEVSFDREDLQEAWFPATIQQDLGNGVFSVEYMSKEGTTLKAEVDSFGHLRPHPPLLKTTKNFILQEKVDAFFEFGWWSGVITQNLENGRFVVSFERMNLDKEFSQLELRPHMDLKDGKWLLLSPENSVLQNHSTPKSNERTSVVTKRRQYSSDSRESNWFSERKSIRSKRATRFFKRTLPRVDQGNHSSNIEESRSTAESDNMVEVEKECDNEPFKKPLMIGESVNMVEVEKECDNEPLKKPLMIGESDNMVEVEKECDNEPFKKSLMIDVEKQRDDGVVLDDVNEGSILPTEPPSLPFVKNVSLWKTIEFMDIFQRMPQKPHFQPLERFSKSLREGMAIGYMIAFASLVEKSYGLKMDDEKSTIDDMIKTLPILEEHGFDVSVVRERITKFVVFKDKEEKLGDEVKNLNIKMSERINEKTRSENGIGEIKEHMKELQELMTKLQEQLLVAELEKANVGKEIASLQARLNEAEEDIKNARSNFECTISSML